MKTTRFAIGVLLLVPLNFIAQSRPDTNAADTYPSPDGQLVATVIPSGKEKGRERAESRVEIRRKDGALLCVHDFSSADGARTDAAFCARLLLRRGEHGYGVDGAQWTPDSQFFVFPMSNSGGHMPLYVPVAFWSRSLNRFSRLDNFTASLTFSVVANDGVKVSTWPEMKPVTLSLRKLHPGDATVLH